MKQIYNIQTKKIRSHYTVQKPKEDTTFLSPFTLSINNIV